MKDFLKKDKYIKQYCKVVTVVDENTLQLSYLHLLHALLSSVFIIVGITQFCKTNTDADFTEHSYLSLN
jgi:hypothetical protein